LPRVVNFELPNVPEDYVHRIGRTGRAGSSGAAVSLVDPEEMRLLKGIERLIRREIVRVDVEGFVPPVRIVENSERPPMERASRRGNGAGRDAHPGQRAPQRHGTGGAGRPGAPRREAQSAALFTAPKPGSRRGR
jgi:ATP-dependent RNA helicase RhlE